MAFQFDEQKSRSNKLKHGIDFVEAQLLWADPKLLRIASRLGDEPRRIVVGMINDKLWTAITTDRGGQVRIISVRRAREDERELYEI